MSLYFLSSSENSSFLRRPGMRKLGIFGGEVDGLDGAFGGVIEGLLGVVGGLLGVVFGGVVGGFSGGVGGLNCGY